MKTLKPGEVITEKHMFFDVEAADRFELIRKTIAMLADSGAKISDVERLAAEAIEREEELPTGIEAGIAMPHARTATVRDFICAFVKPAQPLDFGSPNGQPSDIVFFAAVPEKAVDTYLHMTAALVRRLHNPEVVEALRNSTSPEEVMEILSD